MRPNARFVHFGKLWPLRIVFRVLGDPGSPGEVQKCPKNAPKRHRGRCVPGTSQASAEAGNNEVAILPAPAAICTLLEWGVRSPPTGCIFLRGRGGVAGPVCPLSVCLSACLRKQTRKIRGFSKIRPSFWPFSGAALLPWTFEVMLENICCQIFPKQHFSGRARR